MNESMGAGQPVLLLHGGGWGSGHPREMAALGAEVASAGFRAILGGYRFAPTHKWPAQHEDVLRLAEESGAVAAIGFSAGAHLASWLGVEAKIRAVVGIAGIYDLQLPLTEAGEAYGIVPRLLSDDTTKDRADASPAHHLSRHAAPHFLVHGEADPLVPVAHSIRMKEQLDLWGVESHLRAVGGMGHGLLPTRMGDRLALAGALSWLRNKLESS